MKKNNGRVSVVKEGFSVKRAEEWYERYASVQETEEDVEELELEGGAIGPNGLALLLEELGVGEDDVLGFVVAWKLNAKTLGKVTREEFLEGVTKLQCDSLSSLKQQLPLLQGEMKQHQRDIYCYAFALSKQPHQKTLDLESARILLQLFLPQYSHTASFVDWLSEQHSYRALNRDQWHSFYDFAKLNYLPDLSDYDDDEGWPCLIDEYCHHILSAQKHTSTAEGAL